MIPVQSIIVTPVDILKSDHGYDYSTTRQLEAGADILMAVLEDYLATRAETQFLSKTQTESLMNDFHGTPQAIARHIGRQTEGDAVLITTINRFSERDGGEYSVNKPASVSFSYQLIHIESGRSLCFGKFDETQQTVLSNLFSFSKASSRKFKWITAEELTREGVEEKFTECSYLSR